MLLLLNRNENRKNSNKKINLSLGAWVSLLNEEALVEVISQGFSVAKYNLMLVAADDLKTSTFYWPSHYFSIDVAFLNQILVFVLENCNSVL